MGAPATHRFVCRGNYTDNVWVNGKQLIFASLSHGGRVATFYGQGTVVRIIDGPDGRTIARAATIARRVTVHIFFTRYRG